MGGKAIVGKLRQAYVTGGAAGYWRTMLALHNEGGRGPAADPIHLATIHAKLGEPDKAIAQSRARVRRALGGHDLRQYRTLLRSDTRGSPVPGNRPARRSFSRASEWRTDAERTRWPLLPRSHRGERGSRLGTGSRWALPDSITASAATGTAANAAPEAAQVESYWGPIPTGEEAPRAVIRTRSAHPVEHAILAAVLHRDLPRSS